ncbi:MAG: hypothetical protein H6559_10445 [Lewinellaceae bacterium]|nr:hypothetical protein [Lewinellaceae bacterium]
MLRFKALLIVLLVIGLIALYVLEFRWFDRTIGMRRLALYGMSIGALLGAALVLAFQPAGREYDRKSAALPVFRRFLYLVCSVLCQRKQPAAQLFGTPYQTGGVF